jgi:FlaG/FlaF family flagellin (archaellin)
MPQAIAGAIVAWLGATGVVAAVLTVALTVAITVGLNALISSIFSPGAPKPSDGQQVTRQAVGSRRRHYGIVHTAGQMTFLESSGGTLGMVCTLGTGEEGDILEHRINNNKVTLNSAGTVTSRAITARSTSIPAVAPHPDSYLAAHCQISPVDGQPSPTVGCARCIGL